MNLKLLFGKKNLQDFLWLLLENFIAILNGVIMGPIVALYLGPAKFGVLGFVKSVSAIVGVVVELGLGKILTRYLIIDKKRGEEMLRTAFGLQLLTTLTLTIIFIPIYILYKKDGDFLLAGVVGILTGVSVAFSLGMIPLNAYNQFKIRSLCRSLGQVLSFVFKILLILSSCGLVFFAINRPVTLFIGFALCVYFSHRFLGVKLKFACNLEDGKVLLKESWPVLLSGLLMNAYVYFDKILIYGLCSKADLGKYYFAFMLVGFFNFLPGQISLIFHPKLGKSLGQKDYDGVLLNYFKLTNAVCFSSVIASSLLFPVLINLIFGEKYNESVGIFSVLIWSFIFASMSSARNLHFELHSIQKYNLIITTLSLMINITLNIFFIPKYGIIGSAYAIIISNIFSSLISNLLFKKLLPIFVLQIKALNFIPYVTKLIIQNARN